MQPALPQPAQSGPLAIPSMDELNRAKLTRLSALPAPCGVMLVHPDYTEELAILDSWYEEVHAGHAKLYVRIYPESAVPGDSPTNFSVRRIFLSALEAPRAYVH